MLAKSWTAELLGEGTETLKTGRLLNERIYHVAHKRFI